MSEQMQNHDSNENLLAAAAHLFGYIVAFAIWLSQKDKSRFVRFQVLQALAFDAIESVFLLLAAGCMFVWVLGILTFGIGDITMFGSQNNPTAEPVRNLISAMQGIPFVIAFIFVPLIGIFFIIRLIAAIEVLQGRNFRYPWLGRRVERAIGE